MKIEDYLSDKKRFVYFGVGESEAEASENIRLYDLETPERPPTEALVELWLDQSAKRSPDSFEPKKALFWSFKRAHPRLHSHVLRRHFSSAMESLGFVENRRWIGGRFLRCFEGIELIEAYDPRGNE